MRGSFSIVGAALLLAGCSIYDSSLTVHGAKGAGGANSGGTGESGSGGTGPGTGAASATGGMGNGGSGTGGAAMCVHKTYPPLPLGKDLGGDIEIVAIQSDIDLGDSARSTAGPPVRFRNIGYDLDNLCT